MHAIVPINNTMKMLMEDQAQPPALADAWRDATQKQREAALKREQFIQSILDHLDQGGSANVAIRNLQQRLVTHAAGAHLEKLARELGKKGKPPSRSTLFEWVKNYRTQGRTGLLTKNTGKVRKSQDWEAIAVQLYNIPSNPGYGAVARRLREDHGFETASESAVRRYLKSLPATLGDHSPQRLGRHLYNNSQKHYIHRTTGNLPVGLIYQGDGHALDLYLEHPVSGGPWRAELTIFMDVRSRYIVAWAISGAESSISTLHAVGRSLVNHQHVPAMVYVDNGCGFKSKIMNDDSLGWYQRMGIEPIFALPGNAKAKGNIERFFRTMERDCNVWFESFVGEGMSQEVATQYFNKAKRGMVKLPTLHQWCDAFTRWLGKYHNRPHPEEKNSTPEKLWATLEKTPVNMSDMELFRPRLERKVQRGYVQLHNRKYQHVDLVLHNGKEVSVEYDLTNDELVTVRDDKGRFICDATLVQKRDYIPRSRIEEARQKSLTASIKRLEIKADEKRARAGQLLDHTHTLANIESVVGFDEKLEDQTTPSDFHDLDIDIYEDHEE